MNLADTAPPWLAVLAPLLLDRVSSGFRMAFALGYAELLGRPSDAASWRQLEYRVMASGVREAMSFAVAPPVTEVCARAIALCDRVAAGDEPTAAEWSALRAGADSVAAVVESLIEAESRHGAPSEGNLTELAAVSAAADATLSTDDAVARVVVGAARAAMASKASVYHHVAATVIGEQLVAFASGDEMAFHVECADGSWRECTKEEIEQMRQDLREPGDLLREELRALKRTGRVRV